MIEFVSGSFFDYDADIRVNTVNCVGVMGAGVALLFKNKYPEMFTDYYNACKRGDVKPGIPHVWKYEDLYTKLTIVNFPTKVEWKNPSEYEYIEKGLIWLKDFLINKDNSIVTLPALGCGHGGLDWDKVKNLIIDYLGELNARILVFEPNSSIVSKRDNNDLSEEKEIIENNIHKILPNDKLYPSKLKGRSALEIYLKGNSELIQNKKVALVVNPKSEEREKNALLRVIDELPRDDKFTFLLGLSNSYEIDIAKNIVLKGFKAIFVIPYGILNLKFRKDLESIWDNNKMAVLSTTSPKQTWKKYENLNSQRLRMKLANITLINSLNYESLIHYINDINISDNKIFYINYWNNDINLSSKGEVQKIGINPSTKTPNILPLLNILDENFINESRHTN